VWTPDGFLYFKGYCHERNISLAFAQALFKDPTPRYTGSFVAILCYKDGKVAVTNDRTRACPLWRNDAREVGNIDIAGGRNIWADAWVEISDSVEEKRWNAVPTAVPTRNPASVLDEIDSLLAAKFNWLSLNFSRVPKVFFSGGIDTLLCLSYFRSLGLEHELVTGEHYDYDQFTCEFDNQIKAHWGYSQIHHWRQASVLATGACGDEYFLRGPATANMMLMHLGLKMEDILKPDDYHYKYFQGLEKSAMYRRQAQDEEIQHAIQTRHAVNDLILRHCINDHQHWHLGHTLTFTPFKDIDILRLVLELDADTLVRNIADASIQKQLIMRRDPQLLQFLVRNKNDDRNGIYRLRQQLYS
jgi:hypothetical protein